MPGTLTPSEFLEGYDIKGRRIPKHLLSDMHGRFAEQEQAGAETWKILCDEVADVNTRKKVDMDRLWATQACAEVLIEQDSSWAKRIKQLETREDFLRFFLLLGLTEEDVSDGETLREWYPELDRAINKDSRFKTNGSFEQFMQDESSGDSNAEEIEQREDMTPAYLKAFEEGAGKTLENMKVDDTKKITFTVGETEYKRSPNALFCAVSRAILRNRAVLAQARQLCIYLRNGHTPQEAKQLLEDSKNKVREDMTPAYLKAFEEGAGKTLENMKVDDTKKITFTVGETEYKRSPKALFSGISTVILGKRIVASGRQLSIYLRDGHPPEEAKQLFADKEKKIRVDMTSAYLKAFERGAGKTLENMKTDDTEKITFTVGETEYTRSATALFCAVSTAILGNGSALAQGRQLTTYLRDGHTPEKAKQLLEEKKDEVREDMTPKYLKAFEKGAGETLENMKSNDNKKVTFNVGQAKYKRSPRALFTAISKTISEASSAGPGKQLCIYLRDGHTPEKAKQLLEEKKDEVREDMTPKYLKAFEKGAGETLENMKAEDAEKITFTVDETEYKRSPNSLFCSVSTAILERSIATSGKQLCIYLRDGHAPEEARLLTVRGDDVLEDKEFEELSKLELEDAVALLRHDRLKLKFYLTFAHPELTETEIDALVIRSFRGLSTVSATTKEEEYLEYDATLPPPNISEAPFTETDESSVLIAGKVRDAESVYISGCWNRRVAVAEDGSFSVQVPLEIGAENEICLMGIDRENEQRSEQYYYEVQQTGEPEDIEALFQLLADMRRTAVQSIQRDPGRFNFLVDCAEQMLIKKFTNDFAYGEEYIESLIQQNNKGLVGKLLRKVLANFRKINKANYDFIYDDEQPYFFQKYCHYRIEKLMDAGAPGVVLGNDPGTGKTLIGWLVAHLRKTLFVTPNNVVSSVAEQAGKFFKHSSLLNLQGQRYDVRRKLAEQTEQQHVLTNIENLRDDDPSYLSDDETLVILDEAHSAANLDTLQTQGLLSLDRMFLLMMTATPAKNAVKARRILHVLYPDDPRFQSDAACRKAFPEGDRKAAQEFNLIFRSVLIRFRAQDVMEEYDLDEPLENQQNRLPHKTYIDPEKEGAFELTMQQCQSTYELFLNWDAWTREYGHYLPNDNISRMDNLRRGKGFTIKHALRQIANNPRYAGERTKYDPKAEAMQRIVHKRIEKEGRPVVIFCQYNSQALKYQKLFKQYNPALYTGTTTEEGWKKNKDDKPAKYKTHPEGGWVHDEQGKLIPDNEGSKILAIDHERLKFQKDKTCKMIICTYPAGAVGVTFTKGKASIEDDLPEDCIEDIQSEFRTCRIDHEHLTHYDVTHNSLVARYPKKFLDKMKKRWVRKMPDGTYEEVRSKRTAEREDLPTAYDEFFAQETYDQVNHYNLGVSREAFYLVNDGIADESVLEEGQIEFSGLAL